MFGFFEGWQENPISRNYVLLSGTHEPTKEGQDVRLDSIAGSSRHCRCQVVSTQD